MMNYEFHLDDNDGNHINNNYNVNNSYSEEDDYEPLLGDRYKSHHHPYGRDYTNTTTTDTTAITATNDIGVGGGSGSGSDILNWSSYLSSTVTSMMRLQDEQESFFMVPEVANTTCSSDTSNNTFESFCNGTNANNKSALSSILLSKYSKEQYNYDNRYNDHQGHTDITSDTTLDRDDANNNIHDRKDIDHHYYDYGDKIDEIDSFRSISTRDVSVAASAAESLQLLTEVSVLPEQVEEQQKLPQGQPPQEQGRWQVNDRNHTNEDTNCNSSTTSCSGSTTSSHCGVQGVNETKIITKETNTNGDKLIHGIQEKHQQQLQLITITRQIANHANSPKATRSHTATETIASGATSVSTTHCNNESYGNNSNSIDKDDGSDLFSKINSFVSKIGDDNGNNPNAQTTTCKGTTNLKDGNECISSSDSSGDGLLHQQEDNQHYPATIQGNIMITDHVNHKGNNHNILHDQDSQIHSTSQISENESFCTAMSTTLGRMNNDNCNKLLPAEGEVGEQGCETNDNGIETNENGIEINETLVHHLHQKVGGEECSLVKETTDSSANTISTDFYSTRSRSDNSSEESKKYGNVAILNEEEEKQKVVNEITKKHIETSENYSKDVLMLGVTKKICKQQQNKYENNHSKRPSTVSHCTRKSIACGHHRNSVRDSEAEIGGRDFDIHSICVDPQIDETRSFVSAITTSPDRRGYCDYKKSLVFAANKINPNSRCDSDHYTESKTLLEEKSHEHRHSRKIVTTGKKQQQTHRVDTDSSTGSVDTAFYSTKSKIDSTTATAIKDIVVENTSIEKNQQEVQKEQRCIITNTTNHRNAVSINASCKGEKEQNQEQDYRDDQHTVNDCEYYSTKSNVKQKNMISEKKTMPKVAYSNNNINKNSKHQIDSIQMISKSCDAMSLVSEITNISRSDRKNCCTEPSISAVKDKNGVWNEDYSSNKVALNIVESDKGQPTTKQDTNRGEDLCSTRRSSSNGNNTMVNKDDKETMEGEDQRVRPITFDNVENDTSLRTNHGWKHKQQKQYKTEDDTTSSKKDRISDCECYSTKSKFVQGSLVMDKKPGGREVCQNNEFDIHSIPQISQSMSLISAITSSASRSDEDDYNEKPVAKEKQLPNEIDNSDTMTHKQYDETNKIVITSHDMESTPMEKTTSDSAKSVSIEMYSARSRSGIDEYGNKNHDINDRGHEVLSNNWISRKNIRNREDSDISSMIELQRSASFVSAVSNFSHWNDEKKLLRTREEDQFNNVPVTNLGSSSDFSFTTCVSSQRDLESEKKGLGPTNSEEVHLRLISSILDKLIFSSVSSMMHIIVVSSVLHRTMVDITTITTNHVRRDHDGNLSHFQGNSNESLENQHSQQQQCTDASAHTMGSQNLSISKASCSSLASTKSENNSAIAVVEHHHITLTDTSGLSEEKRLMPEEEVSTVKGLVAVVGNEKGHTNATGMTDSFKTVDTNTATTNGNRVISSILRVIDPTYVDDNKDKKVENPCDIEEPDRLEKGAMVSNCGDNNCSNNNGAVHPMVTAFFTVIDPTYDQEGGIEVREWTEPNVNKEDWNITSASNTVASLVDNLVTNSACGKSIVLDFKLQNDNNESRVVSAFLGVIDPTYDGGYGKDRKKDENIGNGNEDEGKINTETNKTIVLKSLKGVRGIGNCNNHHKIASACLGAIDPTYSSYNDSVIHNKQQEERVVNNDYKNTKIEISSRRENILQSLKKGSILDNYETKRSVFASVSACIDAVECTHSYEDDSDADDDRINIAFDGKQSDLTTMSTSVTTGNGRNAKKGECGNVLLSTCLGVIDPTYSFDDDDNNDNDDDGNSLVEIDLNESVGCDNNNKFELAYDAQYQSATPSLIARRDATYQNTRSSMLTGNSCHQRVPIPKTPEGKKIMSSLYKAIDPDYIDGSSSDGESSGIPTPKTSEGKKIMSSLYKAIDPMYDDNSGDDISRTDRPNDNPSQPFREEKESTEVPLFSWSSKQRETEYANNCKTSSERGKNEVRSGNSDSSLFPNVMSSFLSAMDPFGSNKSGNDENILGGIKSLFTNDANADTSSSSLTSKNAESDNNDGRTNIENSKFDSILCDEKTLFKIEEEESSYVEESNLSQNEGDLEKDGGASSCPVIPLIMSDAEYSKHMRTKLTKVKTSSNVYSVSCGGMSLNSMARSFFTAIDPTYGSP